MKVVAYLKCGARHEFKARDRAHAREIAGRIVTEYLRVEDADGTESFYPITELYKAKIVPEGLKADTQADTVAELAKL